MRKPRKAFRWGGNISNSRHKKTRKQERIESKFDEIPDELLAIILQKLPIESIFRFKLVCVRWFFIISDPFFAHSYRTNNPHNPPWGFIFSRTNAFKVAWFRNPRFVMPNFSFDFDRTKWSKACIKLLAANKGLLLSCSTQPNSNSFYHVWNPLTMKFITVPPPLHYEERQNEGFVVENDGNFWIVRLAPFENHTNYLEFEVFTSRTGTWRSIRVYCPSLLHSSAMYRAVICKGSTHWLSGNDCIAFDPRKGNDHFRVIRTPGEHVNLIRKLLGISCDSMFYCEIHDLSNPSIRVWELINYEDGEWSSIHEVDLEIWKLSNDFDDDEYSLSGYNLIPVAFHPLDSNILFFECFGRLVSCELATGNLQLVANVDLISVHELILFVLPSWPTPVPVLSEEAVK